MGRLNNEEEEKPLFRHFTHEHPLELTNLLETSQVTCFGCGLDILPSKGYYTCTNCTFSLHSICYNMPRKISHPADPDHNLILILSHSFECKACGDPGSGFSYKCQICLHNYHSLCSVMPLSKSHYSHPHTLKLEFSPPYEGIKAFRCDICKNPGFDNWLYRCGGCDFDVHLNCAKSNRKPETQTSDWVQPNGNNFNPASISITDFVRPNGIPMAVSRAPPSTTTMGSSMGTSQFRPSGTYVNGNNYANGVQPNGNNLNPLGTFGTNQTGFVQTNGYPVAVPQTNQAFGYGNQTSFGSNQGPMSGMKEMLVAGVASGIGQAVGQEIVHSVTSGWGDGSGSSNNGGDSDILSSWIGGSENY